ncbi:molybdate transport system ATP-binding protein [Microbacterium sp. SLBN-154]|uniref:ABC transporter ATP-binding protein n=1 Tax=Microbacterium sp. SLBN-154 TaxID=2768458 RepID=UPI0011545181|nr:ABC transporter ATP-binding protein [Microbacterium sp. SLBN-154]TQK20346.1 molybdate transport system ATP-binding protein [Microbacterium sp. SLBN-154]
MTAGRLEVEVDDQQRGDIRLSVSFVAEPGEVVGIMGPSGAGKSTLLGLIAGTVRLDSGRVVRDGRVLSAPGRLVPAAAREVVLLGQDARLFPHLSAAENIAFGPRARGVSRSTARSDAASWLERVGLAGLGDRRPGELSGGQQQRVALARALVTDPAVLLLDEPFTSLDPVTADDLRAVLRDQLVATGVTAVVVTHDALDAAVLTDTLIVVEAGRVSQRGPTREVLTTPATAFVARIAGLNRVEGVARDGAWERAGRRIVPADSASRALLTTGRRVWAVFRPSAAAIASPDHGAGAAEKGVGGWPARIVRHEATPSGVRLHTDEPPLFVDADLADAARFPVGADVIVTLDDAAVRLTPDTATVPDTGGVDSPRAAPSPLPPR